MTTFLLMLTLHAGTLRMAPPICGQYADFAWGDVFIPRFVHAATLGAHLKGLDQVFLKNPDIDYGMHKKMIEVAHGIDMNNTLHNLSYLVYAKATAACLDELEAR